MDGIFISDFDNTLTLKDFYWIVIDDYIGDAGREFYDAWKKEKKIGVDFLNAIFGWRTFTEEEHAEALSKVIFSPGYEKVLKRLDKAGMDFMVLSAGFDYYIRIVLAAGGLEEVPVVANRGRFQDGHFIVDPDPAAWYYSPLYGVDKEAVVRRFKEEYGTVYFAGDSEPDFLAAKAADVRFAKTELARLLDEAGISYHPYEDFHDIARTLKGLLK